MMRITGAIFVFCIGMRLLIIIFAFFVNALNGQSKIELTSLEKTPINADRLVSLDNQGNMFFIKNNALNQLRSGVTNNYADIPLGQIFSVDAFNPLKINVFYKDFNTVVILDNRLNEIYRLDFNDIRPFRNVAFSSTGNDNTLWLFNQNSLQLEIYDYKQDQTRGTTLPIEDDPIAIESNFNSCWLLTEKQILNYSYFGSMISKMENEGFTDLVELNDNLILKKENKLFFMFQDSGEIISLDLPELLIKAFFATDETLYIYDGEFLHKYQIKII